MPISEIDAVACEVRIAARPETVFEFFVDQSKLLRWMGTAAQLDPRPGGAYRININGADIASGVFTEIVPHQRIVMTWGWEGPDNPLPPGSSSVEVTLTPDGDGTQVRLIHRGLVAAELREAHRDGWQHYLNRLVVAAPGGDPGPDPHLQSGGAPQ